MKRTLPVTILFILAILAGVVAVYNCLQYLGLLPFNLFGGKYEFYSVNWLGGLTSGLLGLLWFWVARMIWNLNPSGWMFIMAVAAFNLIFATAAIFGQTTFYELLPTFLLNGLIVILGFLPSTKKSFELT